MFNHPFKLKKIVILFSIILQACSPLWAQYDFNYIPYRKGEKWGYCDSQKRVLVKPVYDEVAERFIIKESLKVAVVTVKNKQGLIDTAGKLIIPCKYSDFGFSAPGIITFGDGKSEYSYSLADKKTTKIYDYGEMLPLLKEVSILEKYYEPERLHSGLFKVVQYKPEDVAGKYNGHIRSDSIIVKADTLIRSNSTDTIFIIKDNNKWGLASFEQNIFLKARFDTLIEFSKGSSYVLKEGHNWILYKRIAGIEEFIALNTDFFKVAKSSPLYFLIRRDTKFGILDINAKTIVPFLYDSLVFSGSSTNRVAGMIGKNWKLYDLKSNEPIDSTVFEDIRLDEMWKQLFLVKKKNTWYIHARSKDTDFIYPHPKPYYGYNIDFYRERILIYNKGGKLHGYASFAGLNYWD